MSGVSPDPLHLRDSFDMCVRACMHDPEVYDDPETFRPERFIRDGKLDTTSVRDPSEYVFGFGRRYVEMVNTAPQCRRS